MEIVKPKPIELLYSNIPADTHDEYDNTATYSLDDIVKVSYESDGTTARTPVELYKSLQDSNVGNYPPDNPDLWENLGATNRWKMFDIYTNTQSVYNSKIEIVIKASNCSAFALLNMRAHKLTFEYYNGDYTDSNNLIETKEIDLNLPINNWYDYFFSDFHYIQDYYYNGLVLYYNGQLKLIVETTDNTDVKIGTCVIGISTDLGLTQYELNVSMLDFSRKTIDENTGNVFLKQGNWAKKIEADIWLSKEDIDRIYRRLVEIRGMPIIWNFNNVPIQNIRYESLLLFGFFRNFYITIPNSSYSKCSFEIDGII